MKRKAVSPEKFLAAYPPPLQELANRLRAVVRETLPEVIEGVNAGWGLLSYRVPTGKTSAYFAFIGADGDHAHLGFEYGILLPDPKRMLEGEGTQVRYLTVRRASEIRKKDFALLIRAAADIARNPKKRVLLKLEQDARGSQ
ncbi:MAG: DUF1801 domain-containing protein [Chloroflexi bacterium]|nr:DUF1801 domain-containing protein [Chloroflexota bacterium]